jgi:hypothetical protein
VRSRIVLSKKKKISSKKHHLYLKVLSTFGEILFKPTVEVIQTGAPLLLAGRLSTGPPFPPLPSFLPFLSLSAFHVTPKKIAE